MNSSLVEMIFFRISFTVFPYIGAALLFVTCLGTSLAKAQETPSDSASPLVVQLSPGVQAARWARQNPDGISVYVSIGTHETLTSEDFERGIEHAIERNFGIDAEVWTVQNDVPVTGFQFFMDDIASEVVGADSIGEEINAIIQIVETRNSLPALR